MPIFKLIWQQQTRYMSVRLWLLNKYVSRCSRVQSGRWLCRTPWSRAFPDLMLSRWTRHNMVALMTLLSHPCPCCHLVLVREASKAPEASRDSSLPRLSSSPDQKYGPLLCLSWPNTLA